MINQLVARVFMFTLPKSNAVDVMAPLNKYVFDKCLMIGKNRLVEIL